MLNGRVFALESMYAAANSIDCACRIGSTLFEAVCRRVLPAVAAELSNAHFLGNFIGSPETITRLISHYCVEPQKGGLGTQKRVCVLERSGGATSK
jgi:hypothetical protein